MWQTSWPLHQLWWYDFVIIPGLTSDGFFDWHIWFWTWGLQTHCIHLHNHNCWSIWSWTISCESGDGGGGVGVKYCLVNETRDILQSAHPAQLLGGGEAIDILCLLVHLSITGGCNITWPGLARLHLSRLTLSWHITHYITHYYILHTYGHW